MTTSPPTKNQRKKWKNFLRSCGQRVRVAGIHYVINSRASVMAEMDKAEQDGLVCLFAGGSDCDHVYSHAATTMPRPGAVKACQLIDREFEQAEGPTFAHFIKPDEAPEDNGWRDYIAEAHEDGHPYSVHG